MVAWAKKTYLTLEVIGQSKKWNATKTEIGYGRFRENMANWMEWLNTAYVQNRRANDAV